LLDCVFLQSNINSCVFFGQGWIVLKCVDECIIVGDSTACIESLIQSFHDGMENFILQDKGSIDKYLGFSTTQLDNMSFSLMQPSLIDRVTSFLGIDNGCTNDHLTPVGKLHLNKDLNGISRR
jgi:hypothetical protein